MPKYKIAPLKSSFMLASILIFFIAVFLIKNISYQWAWAIGFLGAIMFCSSLISMTYGPLPEIRIKDEIKAAKKKVIKKKVIKKKAIKKPVKKAIKKKPAKK